MVDVTITLTGSILGRDVSKTETITVPGDTFNARVRVLHMLVNHHRSFNAEVQDSESDTIVVVIGKNLWDKESYPRSLFEDIAAAAAGRIVFGDAQFG